MTPGRRLPNPRQRVRLPVLSGPDPLWMSRRRIHPSARVLKRLAMRWRAVSSSSVPDNQASATSAKMVRPTAKPLTRSKAAAAANDFSSPYVDGSALGTPDTGGDMPLGISRLDVGQRYPTAVFWWNGHIAEIRYYNTRKDNQFLEDLSNGLINEFSSGASGSAPFPYVFYG